MIASLREYADRISTQMSLQTLWVGPPRRSRCVHRLGGFRLRIRFFFDQDLCGTLSRAHRRRAYRRVALRLVFPSRIARENGREGKLSVAPVEGPIAGVFGVGPMLPRLTSLVWRWPSIAKFSVSTPGSGFADFDSLRLVVLLAIVRGVADGVPKSH